MIPKFRAWDRLRKRISVVDRIYFDTEGVQLRDDGGLYWRHFREVILMQSTGLKDKNGKEIFEGDVAVMNGWRRQVVTFGTQEVEEEFGSVRIYRGFNLYLGGGYPNAVMSEFEVVGNIYENPELMEADDDTKRQS